MKIFALTLALTALFAGVCRADDLAPPVIEATPTTYTVTLTVQSPDDVAPRIHQYADDAFTALGSISLSKNWGVGQPDGSYVWTIKFFK